MRLYPLHILLFLTLGITSLMWSDSAAARDFVVEGRDTSELIRAIRLANAHPGVDRIVLQPNASYVFKRPYAPDEPTSLPPITDDLAIIGNRSEFRRYSGDAFGHVSVAAGVELLISELHFADSGLTAMRNEGHARLYDCVFEDNATTAQAAAIANAGTLTMVRGAIQFNTVTGIQDTGGVVENKGALRLENVTFESNRAYATDAWAQVGVALVNLGQAQIVSSKFTENEAVDALLYSGVVHNPKGSELTVENSVFTNNFPMALAASQQPGKVNLRGVEMVASNQ